MRSVLLATSIGPGKERFLPLLRSVLLGIRGVDSALVMFDGVKPEGLLTAGPGGELIQKCIEPPEGVSIHGRLAHMREQSRQIFLAGSWTHIYFHDCDMVPPMDIIQQLGRHEAPVANGLYLMRGCKEPVFPMMTRLCAELESVRSVSVSVRENPEREEAMHGLIPGGECHSQVSVSGKCPDPLEPVSVTSVSVSGMRTQEDYAGECPDPSEAGDFDAMDADENDCVYPLGYGMGTMLIDRATMERTPFRAPESFTEPCYGEDIQWCLDCGVPILVDIAQRVWHVDDDGDGILPSLEIRNER